MKRSFSTIAGAGIIALCAWGCASTTPVRELPPPTVSLKANPTVKISTVGNAPVLKDLARTTANIFLQNNGKVVEDSPDYWIVIYGTQAMRVDNAADNAHNVMFTKVANSNPRGGEEVMVMSQFTTAANAHFVSVVVYDVKSLTPMVNFDFPYYSSSFSDGQKGSPLRRNNSVAADFGGTMRQILQLHNQKPQQGAARRRGAARR